MIILEWIYNYITTPQIYMTPQIEMLGTLGISICLFSIFVIVYVIGFIGTFLTKRRKTGGNNVRRY